MPNRSRCECRIDQDVGDKDHQDVGDKDPSAPSIAYKRHQAGEGPGRRGHRGNPRENKACNSDDVNPLLVAIILISYL